MTYGWYAITKPADNREPHMVCELDHLVSIELGGANILPNKRKRRVDRSSAYLTNLRMYQSDREFGRHSTLLRSVVRSACRKHDTQNDCHHGNEDNYAKGQPYTKDEESQTDYNPNAKQKPRQPAPKTDAPSQLQMDPYLSHIQLQFAVTSGDFGSTMPLNARSFAGSQQRRSVNSSP